MFKTITIWNKTCLFPISKWWVTLFSKIYQIFRIYWHISLLVSVYISIIPMRLTKEHTFWKYMYLLNLKFVRDTHVRWSKVITSATQDIDANENLDNTYVRQKRYGHEVHICLITCRRHQNSFVFSCPNPCPEHTRNKQTLIKNFWSLDKVGTRLEKMNAFHSIFQPKYK